VDPAATLEITKINVTLEAGDSYGLDLDKDGNDDFVFDVRESFKKVKPLDDDGPIRRSIKFEFGSIKPNFGNGVHGSDKFATAFSAGESVSGEGFFSQFRSSGLYDSRFGENTSQTLPEVGATAFIGLALGLPLEDDRNVRLLVVSEEEQEVEFSFPSYGWVEVERGSLTILRTGFQTVAGLAAPIPNVSTVPVPATLPLLLTGAAGLAALRRRKKAA
jgi:hypothetical protein